VAYGTYALLVASCGHEYWGYTDAKVWPYCSPCNRAWRTQAKADNERRWREQDNRERTRHSPKFSRSKRIRIYERDHWVCQLCLLPVDPELTSPHPQSASLDHIVCRSWSERPDHSDANLRLAHLICNSLRGDEGRYAAATSRMR
jgi:hypothetical protein